MKQDDNKQNNVNQQAWFLNYQPTIYEQHIHMGEKAEEIKESKTEDMPTGSSASEAKEELFHFVHPELDDKEAWRIHGAVKRVVKLQGLQMICQYLVQLKNERKVLLPPNPSAAYTELVRMGMPNGEGFNETTFRKYYNK